MIAVSNLSMRFGKKILFENVSNKFVSGCRFGLIGANGVGKSTFMKILAGKLEQSAGLVSIDKDCTMGYLRQDHYAFDEFSVLDTVFQGNDRLWKVHTERDILYSKTEDGSITDDESDRLGDLEEIFGTLGGYEMESEAVKMLKGLNIPDEWNSMKMSQLTGGWKVRILLAQVLFANPDILLLDEPTNHLDMETIEWLVNFLKRHEGTVIVISHDRYFLNAACTHIADLDYGALRMFTGNYDDFMTASAIMIEQMNRDNERKEKRADELKDFISRFGANASKAKQATSRQKELEKLTIDKFVPSSRVAPYIRFISTVKLGDKVIAAENLSKGYPPAPPLFKKFSLHVNPGDRIAIIGANGIGKTTLLKTLAGLMTPDTGKIELGDTVRLSYFPQDSSEVVDKPEMRAIDWLGQFAPPEGMTETALRGAMGKMLFSGEDQFKPLKVLSGGEKARMIVAKMLLEGGNFLVLDEPTNHLDLESIEALNDALTQVKEPMIFVSHDRLFVNSLANRILEITPDGVLDYPGNYDEFEDWKKRNVKKK